MLWLQPAKELSFNKIESTLSTFKKIDSENAEIILDELTDPEKLIKKAKVKEVRFIHIGLVIRYLTCIDKKEEATAFFININDSILIEKTKDASFIHIGEALNTFYKLKSKVAKSKAERIFKKLDNADLIKKAEKESFKNIGEALKSLYKLNTKEAASIFENLNNTVLIKKAERDSFYNIGDALNNFNSLNTKETDSKAERIFNKLDIKVLMEKAEKDGFYNITESLINLYSLKSEKNKNKVKNIFSKLDIKALIKNTKKRRFDKDCKSLNDIKIFGTEAVEILKGLVTTADFIDEAQKAPFDQIGKALNNCKKVGIDIAKTFLNTLNQKKLAEKINEENKYEAFVNNMAGIVEIDPKYTKQILESINNINPVYLLQIQINELKNMTNLFNKLLYILHKSEMEREAKELVGFANKNLDALLGTINISDLGTFFKSMANYMNIEPIIKTHEKKIIGKIKFCKIQEDIPYFLKTINYHCPETADKLLQIFKDKHENPEAQYIGYCHLNFAKNFTEKSQTEECATELNLARGIFNKLKHEKGKELVKKELEELNSKIKGRII